LSIFGAEVISSLVNGGKLAKAEEAYTRAMALHQDMAEDFPSTEGENRRSQLEVKLNYGDALFRTGRLTAARQIYLETLVLYEQALPHIEREPGFPAKGDRLANGLLNVGCLEEAEKTYRLCLSRYRMLPEPWAYIAYYQESLAWLLFQRGRWPEAEKEIRESLEILDKGSLNKGVRAITYIADGVEADLSLIARANGHLLLARILKETQRPEEADQEYRLALKGYEKALVGSDQQKDEALRRYRANAAELLGKEDSLKPDEKKPTTPKQ
jgi:tetratricopeptide (TPR) repeat protein